jgi:hypothetical protein
VAPGIGSRQRVVYWEVGSDNEVRRPWIMTQVGNCFDRQGTLL